MASPSPAPVFFEAVITPYRSLSPRAFRRLIGVMLALCMATSTAFWLLGAWPIAGFSGVEILLAVVLLRANARAARASELVLLTEAGLRVLRTDARGRRTERTLPPHWLRLHLEESPGRVPRLLLAVRGEREEIGAALGEAEKRDLAASLERALHDWRNPHFDNPQLL